MGRESVLAEALIGLGVNAYAPQYEKQIKSYYATYYRPQPLFPSYLFCDDGYYSRKDKLMNLPIRLRSHAIGEVEDGFIYEMREREAKGFIKLSQQREKVPYKKGEVVRLIDYPYIGHFGVFDSALSDNERVVVLLQMFDRKTPVVFHRSQVEPMFAY